MMLRLQFNNRVALSSCNRHWKSAACYYRQVLARDSSLNPICFYRLGNALYKNGQSVFANDILYQLYLWIEHEEWHKKKNSEKSFQYEAATYLHFFNSLPISDNIVVYEADSGNAFGGDPSAIFISLLKNEYCSGWTHVWVFTSLASLPSIFKTADNVIAVERGSSLYCKYLASSKYLVNDISFKEYFIRREGQKYINTIANGVKNFDFCDKESRAHSSNIVRNLHHATHVVYSPSKSSFEFFKNNTCLSLSFNKMASIGLPRLDKLGTGESVFRKEIVDALGIVEKIPVVLFLFKIEDQLLVADLCLLPCQPIECYEVSGKRYIRNYYNGKDVSGIFENLDAVCISDLVVLEKHCELSQLSAIEKFFVMCLTSKLPSLDGESISAVHYPSDIKSALFDKVNSISNVSMKAVNNSLPFIDGGASQRAVDFFLDDIFTAPEDVESVAVPVSLVFGGVLIPNGITKSFTNLLGNINSGRDKMAVVVDSDAVFQHVERADIFSVLPDGLIKIYRVGNMVVTQEEREVLDYFSVHNTFASKKSEKIYIKAFKREFLRVFGYVAWGSIVNFEGYNRFWTSMFATYDGAKKIVFLHSDMASECKTRFPSMRGLFRMFSHYHYLVSVSKAMMEVNMSELSEKYNIPGTRFYYCQNTVNANDILVSAEAFLDVKINDWISNSKLFVSIGRLSTEKDHKKLIKAFSKVLSYGNDIKLIIIGDGPLRFDLEKLISDLGVVKNIKLMGHLSNPYPLLLRSDCFIHPSNHEGQPIVLLEAMVLGRPIIATDIAGNRGTLGNDFGQIISNDEASLSRAIVDFLNRPLPGRTMDFEVYNSQAVEQFFKIISPV